LLGLRHGVPRLAGHGVGESRRGQRRLQSMGAAFRGWQGLGASRTAGRLASLAVAASKAAIPPVTPATPAPDGR